MKRIHFENLNSSFNRGLLLSAIVILVLSFIPVVDSIIDEKWYRVMAYLLIAIYSLRLVFWRNYANWNNKSVRIKLNSFKSNLVKFKDVKSVNFDNDTLTVEGYRMITLNIDVSGLYKADVEKLTELINVKCVDKQWKN